MFFELIRGGDDYSVLESTFMFSVLLGDWNSPEYVILGRRLFQSPERNAHPEAY